MRPRHALAATAILTAITLGSWAALSIDSRKPSSQAAAPGAAPVTSNPAASTTIRAGVPDGTTPNKPDASRPRPCAARPAGLPSGAARISSVKGDFDGDQARDQLLAYAKLDATGQPSQWHLRVALATGGIADLALANTPDWIGPNGLVARRAVDANGDGRDEGFVTSTGEPPTMRTTCSGWPAASYGRSGSPMAVFCNSWSAGRSGTLKASTARAPTGTADAC